MNNPFKIGDKVYHAYHGEGTVMGHEQIGRFDLCVFRAVSELGWC